MERIVLQDAAAERKRLAKLMLDDRIPKSEIIEKLNLSPFEQEQLLYDFKLDKG